MTSSQRANNGKNMNLKLWRATSSEQTVFLIKNFRAIIEIFFYIEHDYINVINNM